MFERSWNPNQIQSLGSTFDSNFIFLCSLKGILFSIGLNLLIEKKSHKSGIDLTHIETKSGVSAQKIDSWIPS